MYGLFFYYSGVPLFNILILQFLLSSVYILIFVTYYYILFFIVLNPEFVTPVDSLFFKGSCSVNDRYPSLPKVKTQFKVDMIWIHPDLWNGYLPRGGELIIATLLSLSLVLHWDCGDFITFFVCLECLREFPDVVCCRVLISLVIYPEDFTILCDT